MVPPKLDQGAVVVVAGSADAGGKSTPQFLADPSNVGVVFSPEAVCRPDGVVMLKNDGDGSGGDGGEKMLALTVGCAVYTGAVDAEKVKSQYSSTDMELAFCGAQSGEPYP